MESTNPSRLIILARYWNDLDFLQASINQIDYWDADLVYLSEGAWDQDFEPRSTDGTRELLEEYAKSKENTFVIDNIRANKNYRINQANTSNLVMQLANCQPGDWMMIIDVDQFYLKEHIDKIKKIIAEEGDNFDYFAYEVCNFLYNLNEYDRTYDTNQSRLPSKLVKGCCWVQTNHLSVGSKTYDKSGLVRKKVLDDIYALHYEGLRPRKRLNLRYSVGDRKSFWEFRGGIRLKNLVAFNGKHSEFAMKILKQKEKLMINRSWSEK